MTKSSYELFFKAISNKTRFDIIGLLRKGPKTVSEISAELEFEQSRVSHSLRYLKVWGFVHSKRDGKNIIYSLDSQHIKPILESIDKYILRYDKRLKTCGILKGDGTCDHLSGKREVASVK